MDIIRAAGDGLWSFWTWIAGDFWPALTILILGFIYTEVRASLDRAEVANRVQLREYMDWKKRYLSGELTTSIPPDPGADPNLRWFVVRKNKKPKKVIISNRGDFPAYNVRVRLADSTRMASWRWRVGAGRSLRFKVGKVPDKNWNGIALDIHWDDKKSMAQKVTFLVPQSEFELPKPNVSIASDKIIPSGSEPANSARPATPPKTETTSVASMTSHPAPTSTEPDKPLLPRLGSSASASTVRGGMHASTNIADRSIPNRTPGIPADFDIIDDDGQFLLRNVGLGDASHVHLEPLDDDQFVVGGGFWLSIPAKHSEPFRLADPRDIGLHAIFFKVTWDDGFRLKRRAKVKIPTKDKFAGS